MAISKSVKQEVSCAVILPLQSKKVSSADSLIHLSTRNLIAQQNLFKNVHIATGKKGSLSLKCFSIIYRGVIYRLCCNVSSITSIVDAQQQHRRRRYDTLCFHIHSCWYEASGWLFGCLVVVTPIRELPAKTVRKQNQSSSNHSGWYCVFNYAFSRNGDIEKLKQNHLMMSHLTTQEKVLRQ